MAKQSQLLLPSLLLPLLSSSLLVLLLLLLPLMLLLLAAGTAAWALVTFGSALVRDMMASQVSTCSSKRVNFKTILAVSFCFVSYPRRITLSKAAPAASMLALAASHATPHPEPCYPQL